MMPIAKTPLARALAAAGLTLAIAVAAGAPAGAEVLCDTDKAEAGECDPGPAAGAATEGAGAGAAIAADLPVEAIRQIVRDYLLEHPEILAEAEQVLAARRAAQEAEGERNAIRAHRAALLADPEAPVGGNPDGAITMVEFFDYRCGYCRRVTPTLETLIAENDDLRIVYKEFPILGIESLEAARAALASRAQGGYLAFHAALMGVDGPFSRDHIMEVARSVGLDDERLARDMDDPAIDGLIEQNILLAQDLGIRGTPAFVIGERLVRGAMPIGRFRAVIADAREALQQE